MANLTFVQGTGLEGTISGTSFPVAYGSNTTGSSFLIAVAEMVTATQDTLSLTDTLGNTWVQAGLTLFDGGATRAVFYCAINKPAGGANTVTVHSIQNSTFGYMGIAEYTNQGAIPLDVVSTWAVGTGTTATSNPITTTATNDTTIALGFADSGNPVTPGAGFNLRVNSNTITNTAVIEDQLQATPGTYTATWTQTSQHWTILFLAIRGASSSGNSISGWVNRHRNFANKRNYSR